ncbi:MAG: hypothetical protein QTN59_14020 [Candidatus Electrothrix communis]|nr:MAG: hypothetical protein QTN59_14020 [Candidatus Electrothrix communis]
MDVITLLIGALSAGSVAAAEATAGQAIKDTYAGLKHLIQQKFKQKDNEEDARDAQKMLDKFEGDPDIYEKPLKKELLEVGVEQEQVIIQKAQELMKLLQPPSSNVNVQQNTTVRGDIGSVQNIGTFSGEFYVGNKKIEEKK